MKRPKINAYLKRKGKSEKEILDASDANELIPEYISLEYQHVETPSNNLRLPVQQPNVSPSTFGSSSQDTTPSAFTSGEFSRLTTPVSLNEPPHEEQSLLESRAQRALPTFNWQNEWSGSTSSFRPDPVPTRPSKPSMPAPLPDPPKRSRTLDLWLKLDSRPSYNCVIDQMLRPDTPTGCKSNQLDFFKILSGSQQVSNQEELIQGLDHQCTHSNHPDENINGRHNRDDLSQRFLLSFFSGCMLGSQGSLEDPANAIRHANSLLKTMIRNRHPACLTTLNIMFAALVACGQGPRAGEFLANVLVFPQLDLCDNPIAASVEFLIGIATKKLNIVAVEIAHLQSIHDQLRNEFGSESPAALVGLYHIAWTCSKVEAHRERAGQILHDLVPRARKALGPSHFLTITCMTMMARLLYHQHQVEASLALMRDAIEAIDLGYADFHPYRLEARHRQAQCLLKLGHLTDAETILQEVVKQRTNVLGRTNDLTERSRKLLQECLV